MKYEIKICTKNIENEFVHKCGDFIHICMYYKFTSVPSKK